MDKKLPKVFANKIDKDISHNEKVYYSKENITEDETRFDNKTEVKNIYQKINDIFASEKYVYKANVEIKTRSGNKKVQIIGKNNGYLITIDNELISINDIQDIKFVQ